MTPDPASVPLNAFQRIIRQWEQVHPYNGAQVITVAASPDQRAVESAWNDALHSMGLGMLHVYGTVYHYNGLPTAKADQTVPFLPPSTTLQHHLSDELNHGFTDHDFPFRPFILRDSDGARTHLGITYRHWAADSVSVRILMREWFVRLFDPPAARRGPVQMTREGYWNYFGPTRGGWSLSGGILDVPRTFNRFRRVRRIKTGQVKDPRTRFTLNTTQPGLIDALRAEAKRRHVTLHDFFLTAAAQTCREHLPFRDAPNRRDLAMGTIVDLRPYSSADLSDTFGLFLGFSQVFCPPEDLDHPDRLLQSIASQTRRQKAERAPVAGILWMGASLVARRVISPKRAYPFYRKHMPLAGGISNVCLDRTWAAHYHPAPLLDYVRVSPTGPMIPLAFTPTTLGSQFNLGLTYRHNLLTDPAADAVVAEFLDRLARLV